MSTQTKTKLLVIRNSALGDVAMTLPIVYSLAEQYPDLEIYFLTRPFFAKLFVNAPDNVHVITPDYNKEYKGFVGTLKLLRMLGKYKFDYVADFHDVLRSWTIDAWMRLQGKKVKKLRKDRKSRVQLLVHKSQQKAYINRYVEVLDRLGFPIKLTFKSLFDADTDMADMGVRHPAVGIAPFARYNTKIYPLGKMKELVRRLVSKGVSVYLFGAKGLEQEVLEEWQRSIPGVKCVAGTMNIVDEMKLMSQLDLMVTMDSANQHLASLAGTRVVSIWGSTVPYGGFLGYNQSINDAICLNMKCQPCTIAGSDECAIGDCKCLQGISVDILQQKINKILGI